MMEKTHRKGTENLPCIGYRHVMALLGFFVFFFLNGQRSATSIALVAMVNNTVGSEDISNNTTYPKSCSYNSSGEYNSSDPQATKETGQLNWDSTQQGTILAASFAGYLITNIPAGRMAEIFGAKKTLLYGNLATTLFTIASPICARWHLYAMIAVQFGRGMAQGFSLPPVFVVMAYWFPRDERGLFSSFVMTGVCVGSVVSGLLSGWLCDVPELAWPSVFYVMGGLNGIFCLIFVFVYHEGPHSHPTISQKERDYIIQGQEIDLSKKRPPVPWMKMFTSLQVFSLVVGLFGYYWASTHFLTVHPAFMGAVLQYGMTENGLFSSLPFLTMALGSAFGSVLSNKIENWTTINTTRKACNSLFSLGFCLSLVGVLLAGCDRIINTISFYFAAFFIGFGLSGSIIVSGDMTPTFAGSLAGISTTLASVSCVILPVFVGIMTNHGTLKEWNNVFYMHISVVFLSGLFFQLFGSAKLQDWNSVEPNEKEENVTTVKPPLDLEGGKESYITTHM